MKNIVSTFIVVTGVLLSGCQGSRGISKDEKKDFQNTPPPTKEKEGDWDSGGGYAITDKSNPWFIQNTKSVRYCVAIDTQNFGVTLKVAEEQVENAFAYWKEEFKHVSYMRNADDVLTPDKDYEFVYLATQEFKKLPCSENVDIKFQMGFLTNSQLKKINSPKDYMGLTIRTSYDRVNLRGKGFVFISPERGSLAPVLTGVPKDRWHRDKNFGLLLVLIHETGHIFGQTHSRHPLMDPNLRFLQGDNSYFSFIDWLRKSYPNQKDFPFKAPHFYSLPIGKTMTECDYDPWDDRINFPYLPKGVERYNCYAVKIEKDKFSPSTWVPREYKFYGRESRSSKATLLGSFKAMGAKVNVDSQGRLFLPKEQTVYKNPKSSRYYNIFEYNTHYEVESDFISAKTGEKTRMRIQFHGQDLEFGILQGSEFEDFLSISMLYED